MLEFWKRREKFTSMTWGTSDFEETERQRPGFHGQSLPSPIDGTPNYIHFSNAEAALRRVATGMVVLGLICCVIITILAFFLLGIYLKAHAWVILGFDMSSVIVGVLQSIVMFVFDRLYMQISDSLASFENHRTETEHEDSIIAKCFLFRFANNYAPMFYIAFVKPYIQSFDACEQGDCMAELKVNMSTVYLSKMLINTAWGVFLPLLKAYLNRRENTRGVSKENLEHFTVAEREFMRPDYDEFDGLVNDFAESVILFGFTTMFISSFPLATLMALLHVYVDSRIFAWKLCHVYRRPKPMTAQDIGTWYSVLELMSTACVLTNSGLVAFTGRGALFQFLLSYAYSRVGSFLMGYSTVVKVWVFVGMSVLVFACKFIVAIIIPDEPIEVRIQLERQDLFIRKFLHNEEDILLDPVREISFGSYDNSHAVAREPEASVSDNNSSAHPQAINVTIDVTRKNSSSVSIVKQSDTFHDFPALKPEEENDRRRFFAEFRLEHADPDHVSPVADVGMHV